MFELMSSKMRHMSKKTPIICVGVNEGRFTLIIVMSSYVNLGLSFKVKSLISSFGINMLRVLENINQNLYTLWRRLCFKYNLDIYY